MALADIVGQYQRGQAIGTEQREQREARQRQSRLSELAQLAYGAQGPERQAAIGQAYGVDPGFAAQLSGQLGREDESRQTALLQSARLLQSAPPEYRPALYQRIRPSLSQYLPDLPPEYSDQVEQGTRAFIAAYGGPGGGDVKVVGNALVDPTGRVIYEAPQRFQTDAGLIEVGPQGAREITLGAANPSGVYIDPSLPPEVQADIRARPDFYAQAPESATVPDQTAIGAVGGRILPRGAGAEQQRLTFAQQAADRAAQAEERAAIAAQRAAQEAETRRRFGTIPPGFRVNAAGDALEPVPGGPKPAGAAATEGERKAATLLKRLEGSLSQLDRAVKESPSAARPGVIAEFGRSLPFIGESAANVLNPQERQRVESAQLDILDAALTLGTGAAYTREQLEGYRRSFFPQLGDSQPTIDDKQARLQNVIEAARIAAGRAAPQVEQTPGQQAPSADDDALINKYLR